MLEPEIVVDGNASEEEVKATPKLEESPSSETSASFRDVPLGNDPAKPENEAVAIVTLEGQQEEADEEEDKEELQSKRSSCYMKMTIGLILLGFVLFVIIDTATNGYVKEAIHSFLEWIEDNPVGGMFVYIVGSSGLFCICVCVLRQLVAGFLTNFSTFMVVFSLLCCNGSLYPGSDPYTGRRFRIRRGLWSRRRHGPGDDLCMYWSKPWCHCIILARTLPATRLCRKAEQKVHSF
jgi:hypothetical protein